MNLPDAPLLRVHRIETEHIIGEPLEQRRIMQNAEDRAPILMRFLPQNSEHASAKISVEIRDRLIGQQQLRFLEKRARHRGALLFAAGNIGRAPVQVRAQAEVREQERRRFFVGARKVEERLPPRITPEPAAEHVAQDAAVLREQEILEDNPDAFLVIGRLVQTAGVAGKRHARLRSARPARPGN